MNLSDLVYVFKDAMPSSMCDYLVESFKLAENAGELKHTVLNKDGKRTVSFMELNLMESPHIPKMMRQSLVRLVKRYAEEYRAKCGVLEHHWPEHTGMEQFRMKRYAPGGDCFSDHVDVIDHTSARRFLSFLFYLNTPEDGGETVFKTLDKPITVVPERGTLLVFPPLWMFPHAGLSTINNSKYIISGYLHYL